MAPRTYQNKSSIIAIRNSICTAFTLVETLVVIAIVVILAGMTYSVMSRAKVGARKSEVASNLRSIHQSLLLYATSYDDRMAFGTSSCNGCTASPEHPLTKAQKRGIPTIKSLLEPYGASDDLWKVNVGLGPYIYQKEGSAADWVYLGFTSAPLDQFDPQCPAFAEKDSYLFDGGGKPVIDADARTMIVYFSGSAKFDPIYSGVDACTEELYDFWGR